jgi:uncharacterized glyoxalase superfamily protein PhnB
LQAPPRTVTIVRQDDVQPRLVPELDVSDLDVALAFYVQLVGFTLMFERPKERFAYLELEGAHLMIQEATGPGRRFRTAPLEQPFGRGINFQIEIADVDAVYERVRSGGHEPLIPMEERWYDVDVLAPSGRWDATGPSTAGNRQFVVADPDGYLWRFYSSLGPRPHS